MVFESIVTDVLNKVLGDYVENLDYKQLKIGIWGGDVVLTNLRIKSNALDELDLPVQLVYGYIGKLVLKIPWKNLYSQPVIVDVEHIYALVTPNNNVRFNPEKQAKLEFAVKKTALDALEAERKRESELGADSSAGAAPGFTEKLTAQIINNLQIKISNMHVRYEDSSTSGRPFAFGVTLSNLELFTTDDKWEKTYMTERSTTVFKIANLSCLACYFNCHGNLFYGGEDTSKLLEPFKENIADRDFKPKDFYYVVGPISCNAKLKLHMNPENDIPAYVDPKIDLDLEMETLNVGMTNTQFTTLLQLVDAMNRMQLGRPYRAYRPFGIPYKGHAKEWWQFAITCVMVDVKRRSRDWSWGHILEHRQRCLKYAENYRERELSKKPTVSLLETINLLEHDLELFSLLLIRQRVNIEIAKLREEPEEKKAGWFSGWWGGGKKKEDESRKTIANQFEAAMTSDEKAKMFKAIGYEESTTPQNEPIEYVGMNMRFKLISMDVGLYQDKKGDEIVSDFHSLPPILQLCFSMTTALVTQRPSAGAICVTAGMKELKCTGMSHDDFTPILIKSIVPDDRNLLDIFFETSPLDKKCDQRVKVVARPLQIVYDAQTVISLLDIFKAPTDVNLSNVEEAANAKLIDFKERSATGMQYMIDQKPILEIDILLMPNILVVPRGGFYEYGDKSMIVLSLGQVRVTTIPRLNDEERLKNLQENPKTILQSVMQNSYDRYIVQMDDIQALIVLPKENWQEVLKLAKPTDLHVLRPISFKVTAAMCFFDNDPRMPKSKIDIHIPTIQFNITEDRVFEALNIALSIPLPTSDEPAQPPVLQRSSSSISTFLNREIKKRNERAKTKLELQDDEVVQYTNIEVNFSLNEIYLVLNKSPKKIEPDPIDIESPFLTPEDHPQEIVPKSPVFAQSDYVETSQHLLSLQVLKLEAQMVQRTFETVAVLKLGSINFKQFDTENKPNTETKIVDILDTPRVKENEQENYLLTILYKLADKHAPDFITKYQSTEQSIKVNFEVLDIVLHQEFLLNLLALLNGFQNRLDNQVPAMSQRDRYGSADADPVRSRLATIMEETTSTTAIPPPEAPAVHRQGKRVESIKIRLLANLKQLSLKLTTERRPLALMNVQKFVTDVTLKESYTEVNIGLKNILIEDLNPETVHSNILSMVGKDVFNCQVVMFNKEFTQNYNSDDMKVTVDIGCMKVIFVNWFVVGVMSFLNNFQAAQKAVSDAGAAAAETARLSAIEAYEKSTRMKINVRIKAPIILIPVDSNSMDALSLDLGLLELTNQISDVLVKGHTTDKATIDEIKLNLNDMKITKVVILGEGNTKLSSNDLHYMDVVDAEVGIRYSTNIMKPMSFSMTVVRNLSSVWYKAMPEMNLSGRLKSIELTLGMADYALVMAILNKNLAEGVDEFPPMEFEEPVQPQVQVVEAHRGSGLNFPVDSTRWTTEHLMVATRSGLIYDTLKFNFQFDGVVINLLEAEDQGLARFGIYYLSVKGAQLNNGTMNTSIVLCNMQLDDTRPNLTSKIRQYLSCKDWQKNVDVCFTEHKYMVDLTAIMNANETFVEMRIRSFDLIVCLDFLLKLTMFVTLPPEEQAPKLRKSTQDINPSRGTAISIAAPATHANPVAQPIGQTKKKMNIILHLEEPDIILVESLNDPNLNCIIFNTQANLNYRAINDKQIINGEINELKMYMCAFAPERRQATRHYILHPATISLQGSTPEEEGLHVSLKLSDIIINISPATIELLNKAMNSISTGSAEKAALDREETDYSDIWYARPFKPRNFWFTRAEKATDALKLEYEGISMSHKTETCVIEVPNITVVLESGVGYYTKPLISLDTRMTAVFNDWSRNLTANGSLTLNMNYFNSVLAEWEPIIELNEVRGRACSEYTPWELKFDISLEDVPTEFDDSLVSTKTNIRIHSKHTLEITVSKTCLGLLTELGAAFSEAIDKRGLMKPEISAPYFLQNETGVDITLNLRSGIFTLDDVHRLNRQASVNKSIIFQFTDNAKAGEIEDTADIITCTISAGGRAYLKLKDFDKLDDDEMQDYNLYVKVGDIPVEVVLPVTKSDIRYFPLGLSNSTNGWAIVSQVSLEYGATKISVRGMVAIHNHFTTRISVYRRDERNTQIFVGHAEAGIKFYLPLHCIYAEPKEIYFSLSGYNTSVQGVSWHINPSDLQLTQQVQLDPIDTFEALYIDAKRHKAEIYFENTNRIRLNSCVYTLHLRPPLYLRNNLPIDIKVSVAGCSVRKQSSISEITAPEPKAKLTDTIIYEREEFLDYGEMELNPGHVLHLPTVRMFQKGTESKSVIVVRLLNYVEKDWSYATEILKDRPDLVVWTFCSYDSEVKMEMDIYVQTSSRYGSVMLTLYSPFWMINKTGQMLTYKTESSSMDVLYHPPEYSGPILYTVRDKFFEKKRTSIRVDSGAWSDKIPLDVAGSLGSVTCAANGMKYEIGVHNHFTHNSLTKMITFIPFYIVCNKCQYTIELQEQERPGDPWTVLESQQIKSLWPKNDSTHKLIVRVEGKITPAFDFTEVSCTLLKLEDSCYGGVTVDVQTTEGGIYITFTEYIPNEAPGLIINHTRFPIKYYEKNSKKENTLLSRHTNLYAWDDPAGPKILMFGLDEQKTDLKRDEIGTVMIEEDRKAYWVSFLDGMQRVLLFTEVEALAKRTESSAALQVITQSIELHIHGIGLSVVNNETGLDLLYLGIKSSGIVWESKKASKKRFKEMTIHDSQLLEAEYQRYLVDKAVNDVKDYKLENKYPVNFETMKLMKFVDRKIKRTFYPAIWVKKQSSPFQNQLHVKINRIQVDNQYMDPIFPVVLAPVPPPKSISSSSVMKPFIECSMVQRVIPNSLVTQFKYASILIQEFFFKVDIMFLTGVSALFSTYVSDEESAKLFRTDVESIEYTLAAHFEEHSKQEQKNYYDNLHLGPLKIHVSFSMAGADTTALPGFLDTLVQGVGVTLTDVNDVVFRLAFFQREYQFFTQPQLVSEITSHYTGQALKQLYVLALGLDVLGNPYGLVVGIKKGVEDLFYEPLQGAVQGPGEFAEGLVLGVKSLFGHTVGGAAGAVSKITGAMGKGLAALTFDEEYQKKRRRGMNNKPANFHEGLARSGKGLVMGFVDGVTGVVTKPVSGAREEGVEGFFKGLGKGAIGLVARPTAGVVDFASGSFEAVKRATESGEDAKRLRPPRFQHYDNVLRPYCYTEALGNKILKELDKGKYATTDSFIHIEEIIAKVEFLLVSNHRLIYAQRNEMFGVWTSLWSYQWSEIENINAVPRGIQFKLKREPTKRMLGLFSSGDAPNKLVLVPDERRRETLIETINEQCQESLSTTRLPSSRYSNLNSNIH